MIILQSQISIDLLDADKAEASVNRVLADPTSVKNQFLVTCVCTRKNQTKLSLKVRTTEGVLGSLNAYIIPQTERKLS